MHTTPTAIGRSSRDTEVYERRKDGHWPMLTLQLWLSEASTSWDITVLACVITHQLRVTLVRVIAKSIQTASDPSL